MIRFLYVVLPQDALNLWEHVSLNSKNFLALIEPKDDELARQDLLQIDLLKLLFVLLCDCLDSMVAHLPAFFHLSLNNFL